jgi:SAM-dependent methyltransferase
MCGTGRIALAILGAGMPLTCVDYSAGLLGVLREKLAARGLDAPVFEQDVRRLALPDPQDWAFIGFHAFAELLTEADRRAALAAIIRNLAPGGGFTCALHNPAVRGPQLDGAWHEGAPAPLAGGGRLEWRWRLGWNTATGEAHGVQAYRELDAAGRTATELEVPVRFTLVEPGAFEATLAGSGLDVVARWGDYGRAPFRPDSPFFIAEARRR